MPPKKPDTLEEQSNRTFYAQTARFFSIPKPIKALFDAVPLVNYPAEQLPSGSPQPSDLPTLYVFSNHVDAAAGRPSFNPSCLRWQTYLRMAAVSHRLSPSSNHASPTGVLPFLLPASSSKLNCGSGTTSDPEFPPSLPVPVHKLPTFASIHTNSPPVPLATPTNPQAITHQALLDTPIRLAWLYNLYLTPSNFSSVACPRYVEPISSNMLVRMALSHTLAKAAETELLKHTQLGTKGRLDGDDLLAEAARAFEALSVVLGEREWFNDEAEGDHEDTQPSQEDDTALGPSLFDASVFAYTHLLLDENMGWKDTKLVRSVRRHTNLVQHRNRILSMYYGEKQR